jgi:hypothetical protein
MDDFEEMALDWETHKPLCWFCSIYTFVMLSHELEKLKEFLGPSEKYLQEHLIHDGDRKRWLPSLPF